MTWHAKAMTTSYVTSPGAGSKGDTAGITDYPLSTASWYFLDAVDVEARAQTQVMVMFGDSVTDGTSTTLNGDDRWTDVLQQRLVAEGHRNVAVVNAGIGGNRVAGPKVYSAEHPSAGGPSALSRIDRDVASLSGVTSVLWLEGINDFATSAKTPPKSVIAALTAGVARIRRALPGVRVIGATVPSAMGSTLAGHGSVEQDRDRKELNRFIREGGVFDAIVDFDGAVTDPATGTLKAMFKPDSTTGGAGDGLHPNRAGYQAMARAIDLSSVLNFSKSK